MTEETEKEIAKEQTRGLYIVALLAIFITLKWSGIKLEPNTNTWLFYVIVSWAVYSFCMVFGYSSTIPRALTIFFKELADIFMWLSLVVSIGWFVVMSYFVFVQAPYAEGLYVLFAIAMTVVYYSKKRRLGKSSETVKSLDK
jgi:cobalamin synthase